MICIGGHGEAVFAASVVENNTNTAVFAGEKVCFFKKRLGAQGGEMRIVLQYERPECIFAPLHGVSFWDDDKTKKFLEEM